MERTPKAYILEIISPDDGVHLADDWFFAEVSEEIVDDYFDGDDTPWVDDGTGFPPLRLVA